MGVLWEDGLEETDGGTGREKAVAADRMARELQSEGTTALGFLVKKFMGVVESDYSDWIGIDLLDVDDEF